LDQAFLFPVPNNLRALIKTVIHKYKLDGLNIMMQVILHAKHESVLKRIVQIIKVKFKSKIVWNDE